MKHLKPNEQKYWDNFFYNLPPDQRPISPYIEAAPAGNFSITDELLALYLAGEKRAGSSVVEAFLSAGEPLPKVGNFWILLNARGEPGCILKTKRVAVHKFREVPLEVARAEGEGDSSLEYWRKAHAKFFTPHLSGWGLQNIDEATIITEYFEVVFPTPLA